MNNINLFKLKHELSDDNAYLDWLKNQIYPDGIKCFKCGKITNHHKLSSRPCYACDYCGNQVYPTSGTLFHKSTTPLKTWFRVINTMLETKGQLTAMDIQREYGMTYKTAWRMLSKIKQSLDPSPSGWSADTNNIRIEKNKTADGHSFVGVSSRDDRAISQNTYFRKHDRTARLLKVQIILYQHPQGIDVQEIAQRCSVSKRTIYRDLIALESELGVPVWEQGTNRGMTEGYFLPPVNFTLQEAVIIFVAARLLQNFVYVNNPNFTSTFMKLNTIFPSPLKKQVDNLLEFFDRKPKKETNYSNFNLLVQAWLSQHQVKICYQESEDDHPSVSNINPYFIEISPIGGTLFVLAYCHSKNAIRMFNIERIIGNVRLLDEVFEIPADFNAIEYLDSTWGIDIDDETEIVKLRFKHNIDALTMINRFHPFQSIETQEDGSTILTLKARDNVNLRYWIMGLGTKIEVLEPPALRQQILNEAKSLIEIYSE